MYDKVAKYQAEVAKWTALASTEKATVKTRKRGLRRRRNEKRLYVPHPGEVFRTWAIVERDGYGIGVVVWVGEAWNGRAEALERFALVRGHTRPFYANVRWRSVGAAGPAPLVEVFGPLSNGTAERFRAMARGKLSLPTGAERYARRLPSSFMVPIYAATA